MDYERKFKDMAIEDLRQLDIRESVEPKTKLRKHDLEVVRAFVERVEKRVIVQWDTEFLPFTKDLERIMGRAISTELAAMEAEVKDAGNDR